jgi:hypothetical protein
MEIYNERVHDLLDLTPGKLPANQTISLSQSVHTSFYTNQIITVAFYPMRISVFHQLELQPSYHLQLQHSNLHTNESITPSRHSEQQS